VLPLWDRNKLLKRLQQDIVYRGKTIAQAKEQLPDITEQEEQELLSLEQCPHSDIKVIVIISRCTKCGKPFTSRISSPEQAFATVTQKVHQGLVPLTFALENSIMTEEQKLLLSFVTVCSHSKTEEQLCCGGKKVLRCLECARAFPVDEE